MNRRKLLVTIAALSVLPLSGLEALSQGRGRGWQLLGHASVGFLRDRDTIHVGRDDGDFSQIQLRVRDNTVHFDDLKVVYGNGRVDDIPIRSEIRAGGQTRVIDLKGNDRIIRRVELVYRSRPSFRGQAVVELWGRG
jgi:hypothetical protein